MQILWFIHNEFKKKFKVRGFCPKFIRLWIFFTMCVFVSEYVNTLACLANSMSNAYCNNNYKNDLYQINFYNVFVNAFQTNHNVGTITTSTLLKWLLALF